MRAVGRDEQVRVVPGHRGDGVPPPDRALGEGIDEEPAQPSARHDGERRPDRLRHPGLVGDQQRTSVAVAEAAGFGDRFGAFADRGA